MSHVERKSHAHLAVSFPVLAVLVLALVLVTAFAVKEKDGKVDAK